MDGRLTVTQNELLEAIRESIEPVAEDALTASEMGAQLGIGRDAARRRADKLVAEGRAEIVKIRRRDRAGRLVAAVGYRLKP